MGKYVYEGTYYLYVSTYNDFDNINKISNGIKIEVDKRKVINYEVMD